MAVRDEVLRFLVETKGDESLRTLAREILALGEAGSQSETELRGLLDQIASSDRLTRASAQYRQMGQTVLETGRELQAAKAQVQAFAASLGDTRTAKQTAELERLRKEVKQVAAEYDAQRSRLSGYRAEVVQLGGSVTALGAAERSAAEVRATATRSVEALAVSLRQQAEAARQAAADRVAADRAAAAAAAQSANEARESARVQAEAARASAQASRERQAQLKADSAELARNRKAVEDAAVAEVKAAAAREKAVRDGSAALDSYNAKQREAASQAANLEARTSRLGSVMASLRGILLTVGAALGFRAAIDGIKNILGLGAATENLRRSFGQLFGGVQQGDAAFESIRKLAKDTGQDFGEVAELAKTLKSFGIDPLTGSLQALIDENVALGGSYDRLQGIVLSLGQAQAKQKLQGEEILQLAERGVPVWDLLAKATGKNVQELQKLSEQGKLGRQEIALLIAEIGKTYQGAAAQGLTSLSGLFQQARDRLNDFLRSVGDSGVIDFFKQKLTQLNAEVDRLAANGKLKEYATSIANAITGFAQAIISATTFIGQHIGAIYELAKAYAAIKLAGLLTSLGGLSARLLAAGQAARVAAADAAVGAVGLGKLGAAASAIPANIAIAIGAVGLELTLGQLLRLKAALDDAAEQQRQVVYADAALADSQIRLQQNIDSVKAAYASAAQVAIASADELKAKNEDQARAYLGQLTRAQQYYRALEVEARNLGNSAGVDAAREQLQRLAQAAADAGARVAAAADETNRALDSMSAKAEAAVESFDRMRQGGESAAGAVAKLLSELSLDVTSTQGLRDAADLIEGIAARGTEAETAIRDGLRAQILKLSDEDFARFREASAAAFADGSADAARMQEALEGINLERLGVDISAIQTGFSDVGRAAVDAFKAASTEVDALGLNATQKSEAIAQAFDKAFSQAKTRQELQALRAALEQAFQQGKIEAGAFAERIAAVDEQLRSAANAADKAGASMGNLADSSRDAADAAASSADAQSDAAAATEDAGDAASSASIPIGEVSDAFYQLTQEAGMWIKQSVLMHTYVRQLNDAFARLADEQSRAGREIARLNEENAKFDELAQEVEKVRREFELLDDNTVESIARKRLELQRNLEREREEKRRAAEEDKRAFEDQIRRQEELNRLAKRRRDEEAADNRGGGSPSPGGTAPRPGAQDSVVIELRVTNDTSGEPLRLADADIRRITDAVLREIELSRRS